MMHLLSSVLFSVSLASLLFAGENTQVAALRTSAIGTLYSSDEGPVSREVAKEDEELGAEAIREAAAAEEAEANTSANRYASLTAKAKPFDFDETGADADLGFANPAAPISADLEASKIKDEERDNDEAEAQALAPQSNSLGSQNSVSIPLISLLKPEPNVDKVQPANNDDLMKKVISDESQAPVDGAQHVPQVPAPSPSSRSMTINVNVHHFFPQNVPIVLTSMPAPTVHPANDAKENQPMN